MPVPWDKPLPQLVAALLPGDSMDVSWLEDLSSQQGLPLAGILVKPGLHGQCLTSA